MSYYVAALKLCVQLYMNNEAEWAIPEYLHVEYHNSPITKKISDSSITKPRLY